jgi:ribosome-binding protein aMBF1 (putative translation factor)
MESKICKDCGRELPISYFKKTRYGERVSVCTECATMKMRENKEKKRIMEEIKAKEEAQKKADAQATLTLADFTPRQLMLELKRRGYEGELTFVQKIDISTL